MSELEVSEKVSIPMEEKKDETEVTEQEKDALLGMLGGEKDKTPAEETKPEDKPVEEAKDGEGNPEDVSADDYLNIKRNANMVPGLQKTNNQNTSAIEKLEKTIAALNGNLAPGEKNQDLTADGLVKALTSEGNTKFLQDMIDKQVAAKMEGFQETVDGLQASASANDYNEQLEAAAGSSEKYDEMLPYLNKLGAAIKEGVDNGNPTALSEQAKIRDNPRYFFMMAKDFASRDSSDRARRAKEERAVEVKAATDVGGPSGEIPKDANSTSEFTKQQEDQALEQMMGL